MGVFLPEVPQGIRQLQQVLPVAAAGTVGIANVCGQFMAREWAEESVVVPVGHVNRPGHIAPCIAQCDLRRNPLVTVLFPIVQVYERVGLYEVGHAFADLVAGGYQRNDPARRLGRASVVVGALPEAPLPTEDPGGHPLEVGEIYFVNQ